MTEAVTKPSIRQTTRILLLEGGSLDRVRNWNDRGDWENRVSSLTAENVNWLKGTFVTGSLRARSDGTNGTPP